MSERLPTTDEIRRSLSYAIGYGIGSLTTSRDDEIPGGIVRRWLNSVKAEAWDEGADFQFINSPFPSTLDKENNPYRKGGAE